MHKHNISQRLCINRENIALFTTTISNLTQTWQMGKHATKLRVWPLMWAHDNNLSNESFTILHVNTRGISDVINCGLITGCMCLSRKQAHNRVDVRCSRNPSKIEGHAVDTFKIPKDTKGSFTIMEPAKPDAGQPINYLLRPVRNDDIHYHLTRC